LESEGLLGSEAHAGFRRDGVGVQYFPNKDAILIALITRFEEALHDAVLNTAQGEEDRS
jgi:hypothetical protein